MVENLGIPVVYLAEEGYYQLLQEFPVFDFSLQFLGDGSDFSLGRWLLQCHGLIHKGVGGGSEDQRPIVFVGSA